MIWGLLTGEVDRRSSGTTTSCVHGVQSQLLAAETHSQFHHGRRHGRRSRLLYVLVVVKVQHEAPTAGDSRVCTVPHLGAVRPIHVQHGLRGRRPRRQGWPSAAGRGRQGGRGVATDEGLTEADLLPGVDEHVEGVQTPVDAVAAQQLTLRVTAANERPRDGYGVRWHRST